MKNILRQVSEHTAFKHQNTVQVGGLLTHLRLEIAHFYRKYALVRGSLGEALN